jgi:catecholate siderophore receptor
MPAGLERPAAWGATKKSKICCGVQAGITPPTPQSATLKGIMKSFTPTRTALLVALALQQLHHPALAQGQPAVPRSDDASSMPPAKSAQPGAQALPEIKVQGAQMNDDYVPAASSVGGKVLTPLRDIPQSVTVINRAVLDAQAATSLSDAVRNVPGITLGGAEGGQIGNNINLRGFSARTDLYLDGMRDRGQYYRDTFYLESIEVLKGPSSMLFGRGSTGGIINQVSKEPGLRDRNEVSTTIGTGGYVRGTADLNRRLSETSALRVNLVGQDVGTTRDTLQNRDFGVAPSLRLGIGTDTQITLSALIEHNHDMPDYGLLAVNGRPLDVRRDNIYQFTDDRTVQDVASFNAKVEHKINANLTLRNQTQLSHYKTDARETAPNNVGTVAAGIFTPLPTAAAGNFTALPLSQLALRYVSHDRVITDQSLDNQTDLIAKFETGSVKHTLITGIELGHDTYDNQASTRTNLPFGAIVNPSPLSSPANSVSVAGNRAQASASTIALYANDTIELGKQWKLVGGLRQDRYHARIDNNVNVLNTAGITTVPSASETDNFTSVRAGAIYQPSEAQSYYVSYGTSFNPSLEQLTLTTGQQNLDPEKNRSIEIGGKWDLMQGNLSLTSALFRIDKSNARTQTSTGVYDLSGDIRVNGFEFGATGRLTPRWQVIGGYTFLDATIVRAAAFDGSQGKVPANTPRNSATLWTTFAMTPEWELGGGATYMSNRFANNTNVVEAGDYTRWDATLAYHQPKYDIRLNLLNLTDRRDFISLIQSDGGRSVPAGGRAALVTATYRF